MSLAENESAVAKEKEELKQRVAGLYSELGEVRRERGEEVEGERRRCAEVRRELVQRLEEVEGERERVKLEVTAYFEEEARRTYHQHRTQVRELELSSSLTDMHCIRWRSWRLLCCLANHK